MSPYCNPFPEADTNRHAIWEMLVARDIEAFVQRDWHQIESDFLSDAFFGFDTRGRENPDSWRPTFPTLEHYREAWLAQAEHYAQLTNPDTLRRALQDATVLRDIDVVNEGVAVAHKKFDGWIELRDGRREDLRWQTLYHCRRHQDSWRIAGFIGYLPLLMGCHKAGSAAKQLPNTAAQHRTAGPYSPVLRVTPGNLVVISGQAAIDPDGEVVGNDLETQARHTLENCRAQLRSAGCTLADVFKVNVYLTDLEAWPAFNRIYAELMPEPRPVRTAVGTRLLPGLLVEVEMWAVQT